LHRWFNLPRGVLEIFSIGYNLAVQPSNQSLGNENISQADEDPPPLPPMNKVSVIIPCFNEQATISQLLKAIVDQSFPITDIEVIIADGMSTDQTREVIAGFSHDHSELAIRIVDNEKRVIPSGLNRAIEAATGDYIIRLDAHAIPDRDYIRNCMMLLDSGKGDNVGGVWVIKPAGSSWIAKSIALAAAHPIAAGDARYRIGGRAQEVDTVPFGAFRRELFGRIGLYDETLLTNEDYEFNVRIRHSGGKIWMDPSIHSIYYARSTFKELSRQYWRYGYWKAQMLRRYPDTIRWRQVLPPLFVLSLIGLGLMSLFWNLVLWMFTIIVILYTIIILAAGIHMSIKHKDNSILLGIPMAIATIHLCWGSAFLWGLVNKPALNTSHQ
jgi:glycosyltransferase involved in cell wall biosynthesis